MTKNKRKSNVSSKKKKKLTPRQQKFVRYFMIHRNATKAAKLAGYSEDTANEQGSRLLTHVMIREKIEEFERKEQEILDKEYNLDMDKIRKRFAMIALGDLRKYASWDKEGLNLKSSEEIDETYGLKSIKIKKKTYFSQKGDESEEETTSIQLDDRVKALTRLGENIGMFRERGEDNGDTGKKSIERRISEIARRIKERRK